VVSLVALGIFLQIAAPQAGQASTGVERPTLVGPVLTADSEGFDGYLVVPRAPSRLQRALDALGLSPFDPIAEATSAVAGAGGRITDRIDSAGLLVADLSPGGAEELRGSRKVEAVFVNTIVSHGSRVATETAPASWGLGFLDRDYRSSGIDMSYRFTTDGSGVDVYIVDTGIKLPHPDFVGRVPDEPVGGWFRLQNDSVGPTSDCNGHGTHVAGTAAGNFSGVARGASIIPVKVFPECSRSTSTGDVVAGLQWILDQVPSGGLVRPAVVNMSLGGLSATLFTYVEDAQRYFFVVPEASIYQSYVERLIDAGFTVVVAAGNDSWPASWYAPANVAEALTVGSLGRTEAGGNLGAVEQDAIRPGSSPRFGMNIESTFSNFGPMIDVFAPGQSIVSSCADPNSFGTNGTHFGCTSIAVDGVTLKTVAIGGTSMAAPHVAGVAARLLGAAFDREDTILEQEVVGGLLTDGGLSAVRALEADRAAPAIAVTFDGTAYVVPLKDLRNLDGSPNVDFTTTDRMLTTLVAEPGGPTGVDVPVLQPCVGAVAGPSRQLAVGGVAPLVWAATAPAPTGYLAASGLIAGSMSGAALGDVVVTVEDAFGRSVSRAFSQSTLPFGCGD